jgi:hypothetical protein
MLSPQRADRDGGDGGASLDHQVLAEQRRLEAASVVVARRHSQCSVGVFRAGWRLVELVREVGKWTHSQGFSHAGAHFLFPEEALHLAELGFLELCVDEIPISIERAWRLLASCGEPRQGGELEEHADRDAERLPENASASTVPATYDNAVAAARIRRKPPAVPPHCGSFSSAEAALDAYSVYIKLRGQGFVVRRACLHANWPASTMPIVATAGTNNAAHGRCQLASASSESAAAANSAALDDDWLDNHQASHSAPIDDDEFPSLPTEAELRAEDARLERAELGAYAAHLQQFVLPWTEADASRVADQLDSPRIDPRPAYYCWPPREQSTFKRSQPATRPEFCMLVFGFDEPPPSFLHLRALRAQYAPIALRFGVVSGSGAEAQVMFMDLDSFTVPDLFSDRSSSGHRGAAEESQTQPSAKQRRIE